MVPEELGWKRAAVSFCFSIFTSIISCRGNRKQMIVQPVRDFDTKAAISRCTCTDILFDFFFPFCDFVVTAWLLTQSVINPGQEVQRLLALLQRKVVI